MNIAYHRIAYAVLLSVFFAISCSKDSDEPPYVPLNIVAGADTGQVFQNETIDIDVLSNDTNVPTNGNLTVANPQTGSVQVINNGTSGLLDDVIRYTPDITFTGDDTFQYTVCDDTGQSCATGTVTITVLPYSPVIFDINQVPYPRLTDYNFFQGDIQDQEPVYGVLPYEPITPLFSDYASKKRFVWMPNGVQAEYVGDSDLLNFPVGSVLIKTFYYKNVLPDNQQQVLETRLMIKKADGWIFADYIWNEAQTEGLLDESGNGANVPLQFVENGITRDVNYRIPATSECFTCHKADFVASPIGMKPQSLNSDYEYSDGTSNQLRKWIELGYLQSNIPGNIETVVKWDDPSEPLELRARAYLDINCNSCHSDTGHCNYRAPRFSYDRTDDPTNLGICVTADTPIPGYEGAFLIDPGDAEASVLYFRMLTTEEQYRMPLLGRTLRHDEGVSLIEEWINSLTQTCN
ncbi:MAG: Ig-like domain-containing protein [Bacteroidota bacterium]